MLSKYSRFVGQWRLEGKNQKFLSSILGDYVARYNYWRFNKHLNKPYFNIYGTHYPHRALLLYSPVSFLYSSNHPWYKRDTLYEQNRYIAKRLHKKGYVVDVVEHTDPNFFPRHHYDLVIDHSWNHQKVWNTQLRKPRILMHIPTSFPAFQNSQEMRRIAAVRERMGKTLNPKRQVEPFVPELDETILLLGNAFTACTYPEKIQARIRLVPNYPHDHLFALKRHQVNENSRRCFLFLGGTLGAIHKGLDLLIEAFAEEPDLSLYICGKHHLEEDFEAVYGPIIRSQAKINQVGWLTVGDPTYQALVEKCCFVILASCSEGMPGSVLSGMANGLIPVVSRESGIDIGNWGFEIPDDIEGIRQVIRCCSETDVEELRERSELARHSVRTLKLEFQKIMNEVIPSVGELAESMQS